MPSVSCLFVVLVLLISALCRHQAVADAASSVSTARIADLSASPLTCVWGAQSCLLSFVRERQREEESASKEEEEEAGEEEEEEGGDEAAAVASSQSSHSSPSSGLSSVRGRMVLCPSSISSSERDGVLKNLLSSEDFVDMVDSEGSSSSSSSFGSPSIFASAADKTLNIVSSPSKPIEAAGAAALTPHDLVYVVDASSDEISHPPSALAIAAIENMVKQGSESLTVVVLGGQSESASNVQDKVLYHIESLLSSSTAKSDRLNDLFSSTTFVSSSKLSAAPSDGDAAARSNLSDFLGNLKQSSSQSRAYLKNIAQSIKITSKPDAEEVSNRIWRSLWPLNWYW